jgi:hypothetical protein
MTCSFIHSCTHITCSFVIQFLNLLVLGRHLPHVEHHQGLAFLELLFSLTLRFLCVDNVLHLLLLVWLRRLVPSRRRAGDSLFDAAAVRHAGRRGLAAAAVFVNVDKGTPHRITLPVLWNA